MHDPNAIQWKKNGNIVFIGNPYTDNAPANGDVIQAIYTVNTVIILVLLKTL